MSLPINIEELLHGNTVEWDRIELKKGWNPEDVVHSLCAYANDINNWDGGYIIIGVEEDKGKAKLPPVGLQTEQLDIVQLKLLEQSHKITPAYIPIFQPYLLNGKYILIIFAPAGDNRPYKAPISLSEKRTERAMYIKRGSKTIKVKDGSEDERRLIELTARIPFDDRINQSAQLADLNLRLIQAYLKEVMSDLYEESTTIPFGELCRHMMIAKGSNELLRPTNAGLLLFNDHPDDYFPGAKIELVIHKNEVGKDYTEKIFRGSIIDQIRDVLQYFRTNIVEEFVIKSPKQAESIRFYNYPFQAIEEAVVNAVYHKSYERQNPVEIQIHKDKIEILSFPGPMPPIDQEMLTRERVVAREYRNRKIGGFLKELKLTEGRGTGLPIIHRSLEENGSPPPIFETDHSNTYFLCIIFIHPLTAVALGQMGQSDRAIDKKLIFNNLNEINTYLSLSVSKRGARELEAIRNRISAKSKQILQYCIEAKSRDGVFKRIGLYNNSKNFQHNFKPLIEAGWLHLTIPDKPTSRDQQYVTTELGKELLSILENQNTQDLQRISVISANIASVGYDEKKMILEIEFHHGGIYQYSEVKEDVYNDLLLTPAKGSYFLTEIKNKYKTRKKQ